jgi:AraC-like DNA-binding protein
MGRNLLGASICFVAQGRKLTLLGKTTLEYSAGQVLVALSDVPIQGKVTNVSKAEPYLGLRVSFSPENLIEVVQASGLKVKAPQSADPLVQVAKPGYELLDAFLRLLRLLDHSDDIPFLAPRLLSEILYRLVRLEIGNSLVADVLQTNLEPQILPLLQWVNQNYTSSLSAGKLAKEFGMSVATLHRRFKNATSLTLFQYQKSLRLLEARRRLITGAADVASVAFEVGYESPSQFGREYKRHFGQSPRKDAEERRMSSLLVPPGAKS